MPNYFFIPPNNGKDVFCNIAFTPALTATIAKEPQNAQDHSTPLDNVDPATVKKVARKVCKDELNHSTCFSVNCILFLIFLLIIF